MVKKITKTNPNLIELINNLKEKAYQEDAAIWRVVAKKLERSNRRTAEVNIVSLARFASEGETVLIPGKVLSNGNLEKKMTVAALSFSKTAQEKIENVGGECISISDLLEANSKGSNIKIME